MHTERKSIFIKMLHAVTAWINQKVHVIISSSVLPLQPKGKTSSMTYYTTDNLNVSNTATLLSRNQAKVFFGVLLSGTGNITVDTHTFDYVHAYITNTQRFV